MLTQYKRRTESLLEPITKPLARVNPNLLTILGSIPPLLFFVAIVEQQYILALVALIGNVFDLIDGMVARKYNKVTAFGGFLDSTLDRVSDFLIITPFAFAGIARWEIVAPFFLFTFLTSYIRAQGGVRSKEGANFTAGVGILERSERILGIALTLIVFILFPQFLFSGLNIVEWGFILLLILSAYTVLQRIMYAYKKL